MSALDPTGRFGDRADAYRRSRPGYPAALYDHLDERLRGLADTPVADLGSGTGILTADLLDRGCRVWAVEPNGAMRQEAEHALGERPGFSSVAGSAEATGLAAGSIELATAAQAFHWFDFAATARELRRILVPAGWVAVIWNDRRLAGGFLEDYEAFLLAWADDYRKVRDSYGVADRLGELVASGTLERAVFDNHQDLDLDALRARLLSSSYLPGPQHPRVDAMLAAAGELFAAHERRGVVRIEYDCKLYLARI
jgi:SAM-dependent methyltransferase